MADRLSGQRSAEHPVQALKRRIAETRELKAAAVDGQDFEHVKAHTATERALRLELSEFTAIDLDLPGHSVQAEVIEFGTGTPAALLRNAAAWLDKHPDAMFLTVDLQLAYEGNGIDEFDLRLVIDASRAAQQLAASERGAD